MVDVRIPGHGSESESLKYINASLAPSQIHLNRPRLLRTLPSCIRPRRYTPPCRPSLGCNLHRAFGRATRIARLLPPDNQSLRMLVSTTIWECRLGLTATNF
ncbi:hypothetical protein ARMGADRAFT_351066 [Armillaria gallica]|uniref:Uncharacterized protein n=1 Tax=Armillaria gallica TaxID=47427 RepID=A0A2H3DCF0_ARMGA|nr:hypothetical protein ARMGADRAFT_351066 [Armillaria gallica]